MWTSINLMHMILLESKLTPQRGSQVGTKEQRRPTSKFFFSETGRDKLRLLVCSNSLWTFVNFIHMMPLGIKTGPTLRVTSWNQRIKDVEFNCGENDSVSDPGPSWPSCFCLYLIFHKFTTKLFPSLFIFAILKKNKQALSSVQFTESLFAGRSLKRPRFFNTPQNSRVINVRIWH